MNLWRHCKRGLSFLLFPVGCLFTRLYVMVRVASSFLELIQWTLYSVLLLRGVFYTAILTSPLPALQRTLAHSISYNLWCWMSLIGPAMCLGSIFIRQRHRAKAIYPAMLLRLGGDILIEGDQFVYVFAVHRQWGETPAAFLSFATIVFIFFFIVRDIGDLVVVENKTND